MMIRKDAIHTFELESWVSGRTCATHVGKGPVVPLVTIGQDLPCLFAYIPTP